MQHLRHPSVRPAILADSAGFGVADSSTNLIGRNNPLGRERVLMALPLDPGPQLLEPDELVRDSGAAYLADTSGAVIGGGPVRVSRMLSARLVGDTRRLG